MSEYNNDNTEDTREVEAMRKMFVGGLNRDSTDEAFFDFFSQFGNTVDKVVIKDPNTKLSRGFGFITYDHSDAVENVFQARPHILDGKTLDVKRAMPRDYNTGSAHAKVTKMFIGGIAPDLTPGDLEEYIVGRHPTSIGTVSQIDFVKDKETGNNKGFGFLECSDHDFADRLTISENSFMINGKKMALKKAEPKEGAGGGRGGSRGGGQRGGFRGGRGGRGGSRGSYNNRNGDGYNQGGNNNYNQGGGYQQQQNSGGYGGYQSGGAGYTSYNNQGQGGYNQGGYQQQNQQSQYGQYQNQGYSQGYGQGNNQGGYGASQGQEQGGYGGNQSNNRYTPY